MAACTDPACTGLLDGSMYWPSLYRPARWQHVLTQLVPAWYMAACTDPACTCLSDGIVYWTTLYWPAKWQSVLTQLLQTWQTPLYPMLAQLSLAKLKLPNLQTTFTEKSQIKIINWKNWISPSFMIRPRYKGTVVNRKFHSLQNMIITYNPFHFWRVKL